MSEREGHMQARIGVIGLGIMGGAIARNLVRNGMPVVGFDVAQQALQGLASAGGSPASSIPALAAEADIIFTSLPTVAAFDRVVADLCQCRIRDRIIVDMSTLPHATKSDARQALAGAGAILLDCPLSGTGAQAEKQDLVVFGSGDRAAFDAVVPALQRFSRRQVYLGDFGAGTTMKFIANHLVAIHNAAAAEAFVLAQKAGLDLHLVYDTLHDSAATSRMLQVRGPMMVQGTYTEPTARISMFLKDLDCIGDFATSMRCPTPLFDATTQLYYAASNAGLDDADTAAVKTVLDRLSGRDR